MKEQNPAFRALRLMLILLLFSGLCLAQTTTSGKSSSGSTASSGGQSAPSAKSSASSDRMDINTASKDKLASLPGIDDATAQKIIDGRPYHAKNDLVRKKIISQATYEKVSGMIIAKRSKTGSSSTTTKNSGSGAAAGTKSK